MQNFEIESRELEDLIVLRNKQYHDSRGYFEEIMNSKSFQKLNLNLNFVQTNHSKSTKGVLRGLHFQHTKPQGKLIKVIHGTIFDVAVDIRSRSANYGKYFGIELSDTNKKMLYIPEGFAHGFLTLSDSANVVYQATEYFYPEYDSGIVWNDEIIDIKWPFLQIGIENPIVSEKDQQLATLQEISNLKF